MSLLSSFIFLQERTRNAVSRAVTFLLLPTLNITGFTQREMSNFMPLPPMSPSLQRPFIMKIKSCHTHSGPTSLFPLSLLPLC